MYQIYLLMSVLLAQLVAHHDHVLPNCRVRVLCRSSRPAGSLSASKSGDKEPEWRFWTSLWRLKYSEAGRKKPGFRFISMNF